MRRNFFGLSVIGKPRGFELVCITRVLFMTENFARLSKVQERRQYEKKESWTPVHCHNPGYLVVTAGMVCGDDNRVDVNRCDYVYG